MRFTIHGSGVQLRTPFGVCQFLLLLTWIRLSFRGFEFRVYWGLGFEDGGPNHSESDSKFHGVLPVWCSFGAKPSNVLGFHDIA